MSDKFALTRKTEQTPDFSDTHRAFRCIINTNVWDTSEPKSRRKDSKRVGKVMLPAVFLKLWSSCPVETAVKFNELDL